MVPPRSRMSDSLDAPCRTTAMGISHTPASKEMYLLALQVSTTGVPQPSNADLSSGRQGTGNSLYRVASSVWSTTSATVSRVKVDAPSKHEFLEKHGIPPSDTVRYFDHRRQRRRLFANSSLQWIFTALVCASLAALCKCAFCYTRVSRTLLRLGCKFSNNVQYTLSPSPLLE